MPRTHVIAVLLLPLLLASCGEETPPWHGRNINHVMSDLELTLINDTGQPVTAADFNGKVVLLYFGFTHCEDVCPTTLATLQRAVRSLGQKADQVRILFVSVDPKRDTPEVLRQHAAHFGPQVVALSGSEAQLDELTRRYRVAYSYGEPDADGKYEVYHSSAIFVFDARGKVRLLLEQQQLDVKTVADDLQRLIDISNSDRSAQNTM